MAKISEFIIKVSLNSGQLKALSGELGELCRQVKTSVSSVCASLNTIEASALNPADSIFQATKKAALTTTETIKQAEVDSQKTFGSIEIFEDSATGEGEFATHEKHLSYEDSGQGTEDSALTLVKYYSDSVQGGDSFGLTIYKL